MGTGINKLINLNIFFILLSYGFVFGQEEKKSENQAYHQTLLFSQMIPVKNYGMYRLNIYGEIGESKNVFIEYFDGSNKKLKSFHQKFPYSTSYSGYSTNDSVYIFSFFTALQKKLEVIKMDSEGNHIQLIQRKKLKSKPIKINLGKTTDYYVSSFLETAIPQKITFYKINFNLDTLWKSVIPAQKEPEIKFFKEESDIFYFPIGQNNESPSILYCINSKNGNVLFEYSLSNDEFLMLPTAIKYQENGQTIISGPYFKNSKIKDKKCEGIFLSIINKDGLKISESFTGWENEISQLKGVQMPNKVIVNEIVDFKDRLIVVLESFDKIGVTEEDVAMVLFGGVIGALTGITVVATPIMSRYKITGAYLFTFNISAELQEFQIIKKAESTVTVLEELMEFKSLYRLKELKIFDYSGIVQDSQSDDTYMLIRENNSNPNILAINLKDGKTTINRNPVKKIIPLDVKLDFVEVVPFSDKDILLFYQIGELLYTKRIRLNDLLDK